MSLYLLPPFQPAPSCTSPHSLNRSLWQDSGAFYFAMCDRYHGNRDFSEPLLIPVTPVDFQDLVAFHNSIVDVSDRPLIKRWIDFLALFLPDSRFPSPATPTPVSRLLPPWLRSLHLGARGCPSLFPPLHSPPLARLSLLVPAPLRPTPLPVSAVLLLSLRPHGI